MTPGASVFDPVLTELTYRWFCPRGGTVLDPFAGGSVRGIVASKLGLRYVGVDLSERQVEANREQAQRLCAPGAQPDWRVGDSRSVADIAADVDADLLFSCPPYGSLERYSDDPRDLSAMSHQEFLDGMAQVVRASLSRLRDDSFAVLVVGDFRDKHGYLVGFPADVVFMFEQAGAHLYNEAVLQTPVVSAALRAGKYFNNRKLVCVHQMWLCFVKGSWKAASERCPSTDDVIASVDDEVDEQLFGKGLFGRKTYAPKRSGNLSGKFRVPPFSIFNTREDWWQRRKSAWLNLGIESEVGRSDDLLSLPPAMRAMKRLHPQDASLRAASAG